jgi:hypothetical protein
MIHKDDATRKSPTYFEQVPVEVVKKIAAEDAFTGENPGTDNLTVEPVARKTNRVPARSLHRKRQ